MKFCVDCANCFTEKSNSYIVSTSYCHAPEAEEARDPINGEWPECEEMRVELMKDCSENIVPTCGRLGKWFKTK